MKKKALSLLLTLALTSSILAGCGSTDNGSSQTSSDKSSTSQAASSEASASNDETASDDSFSGYPIDTDQTLTLWTNQIKPSTTLTSWTESPFHVGLEKMTGISIDYTFPANGTDEGQAFNLMLSDSTLPDMIWYSFIQNAESYIKDGILRDLTDLLPKYAPNYWKFLQENPYYAKSMMTDSGKYYGFGFFREDRWLSAYQGPVIRQDWLDECGLPMPETIEDWETTIRAFKEKYNAKLAFCPTWRVSPGMAGAFGAYGTVEMQLFLNAEGKVAVAQAQPEWKEYISWLHKLNEEGLIDPDIVTLDDASLKTKIANNQVGITCTSMGTLDGYINDAKTNGNGANWVGCPYPVMNKGDKTSAIFCEDPVVNIVAGITTSCPDDKVELALRWLDYPFSEEGSMYWNYGEEGVSYEMVDGQPTFTDVILKSDLGAGEALKLYTGESGWGCGVQALSMVQQKSSESAINAVNTWYEGNEDASTWVFPTAVTMTPEENSESSSIYNTMNTYIKEMALKFITGEESLDNFDSFVSTLNDMGMERLLEIRQAAYDRFINR